MWITLFVAVEKAQKASPGELPITPESDASGCKGRLAVATKLANPVV